MEKITKVEFNCKSRKKNDKFNGGEIECCEGVREFPFGVSWVSLPVTGL